LAALRAQVLSRPGQQPLDKAICDEWCAPRDLNPEPAD
jgi:hypothetical protein